MITDLTQCKVHVVLAEDDAIDVIAVKRALDRSEFPFALTCTNNGDSLVRVLREAFAPPGDSRCVALVDLNMPGFNGLDAIRTIKEDPHLCRIPVFVLTTSEHDEDQIQAWKNGISGYFIKDRIQSDMADLTSFLEAFSRLNRQKADRT